VWRLFKVTFRHFLDFFVHFDFDLSRGFWYSEMVSVNGCMDIHPMNTLQETNISTKNGILKMIFLFPRWDMLIPGRVGDKEMHLNYSRYHQHQVPTPLDVLGCNQIGFDIHIC